MWFLALYFHILSWYEKNLRSVKTDLMFIYYTRVFYIKLQLTLVLIILMFLLSFHTIYIWKALLYYPILFILNSVLLWSALILFLCSSKIIIGEKLATVRWWKTFKILKLACNPSVEMILVFIYSMSSTSLSMRSLIQPKGVVYVRPII